jgi:hypothetical protein
LGPWEHLVQERGGGELLVAGRPAQILSCCCFAPARVSRSGEETRTAEWGCRYGHPGEVPERKGLEAPSSTTPPVWLAAS